MENSTKDDYCFVRGCRNSSKRTPEKRFFSVPHANKSEWCTQAGLIKVPKRNLKICEDHLKLEEDMENYMYWQLMNVRPKLKARVPASLQPLCKQPQNIQLEIEEPTPSTSSSLIQPKHISVQCTPIVDHKKIQTHVRTSEKSANCTLVKTPYKRKTSKMQVLDTVDEDEVLTPATKGSTSEVTEWNSTDTETMPTSNTKFMQRENFLKIIAEKPLTYLGLPKKYFFWIDFIVKNSSVKTSSLNIIVTLYKVRQNDTFSKIADLFQLSLTTLWRLFFTTINILFTFFKQVVFHPPPTQIKHNLPSSFKTNKDYSNIQAIIDCLEIEIEKPSNPVNQALTWSAYKHCNTVKYLISATPDGLINYVSRGYGGRISDVTLVEQSDFLHTIPSGAVILADRGFKHLDSILSARGIRLLRPASVSKNKKLLKAEVIRSKRIASLRIHIERVIRRVRQFKLLKPHATVNNKMISYLDEAIVTAAGLINLQVPIIKNC